MNAKIKHESPCQNIGGGYIWPEKTGNISSVIRKNNVQPVNPAGIISKHDSEIFFTFDRCTKSGNQSNTYGKQLSKP
jgi:hypothetical protein